MQVIIYRTPKQDILEKLKEIRMTAMEDRESPEKIMRDVISQDPDSEGTDTKYLSNIYSDKELNSLNRLNSDVKGKLAPSQDEPGYWEAPADKPYIGSK